MATVNDFVELPITNEVTTISRWLAERRILYEYPEHDSEAFGEYDESHIPVIQEGIIGELITFDYLHTKLDQQFGTLDPKQRWRAVEGRLCLQNQIGRFDTGYDLTINGKTIDVKTYHERKLTKEKMVGYNLFVNVNEVKGKTPADYYIQAFFTPNNTIVLAGCHQGLPKDIKRKGIDRNIRSDAYACPVRNLMPMTTLVDLLLETQ